MDLTALLDQPYLAHDGPLSLEIPLDRPFTTTEAGVAGLTPRHLSWLVAHGFLRRPIRGVYVAAQVADSPRLRARCLHLAVPEDCVICDRHAGWLHGAPMILAPNEHRDLQPLSLFRPAGRGRLRNDLSASGERNLRPDDITVIEGLRVTTPLRTAWDLGRVRWPEPAIAGLDAMLRLGAFSKAELLAGIERFAGMRWVRTLRAMAPLADSRAESPGESVLRLRWLTAGIPAPIPQFEVWADGILIARLDLGNPTLRFAAEYDGAEWHDSPAQQEHDRLRRAAVSDQDWVVLPMRRDNVYGPTQDCEQLLQAGVRQARRQVAPTGRPSGVR